MLSWNIVLVAMRNPFEIIVEKPDTLLAISIPATEQVSLSANSTWQITQHDETSMILKNNQDGEIREIKVAE